MRLLRVYPPDAKVRFMAWRLPALLFTAVLVIGSLSLFLARGLNYGIDFTGGIVMEVRTQGAADLADMRGRLGGLNLGGVELQEFGSANEVLIRLQPQAGEGAQQTAIDAVRAELGTAVEFRRIEVVGPKVSDELFWSGVFAVAGALLSILIYIWFRFEWQFGICALVATIHDVVTTVGLFSLLWMEFNLTAVAAVLTIAGYSINDTVVIFDRVRENLRKYKSMPLIDLFDRSVNETMTRTVNTSGTTLLALFALYILGGEVIRGFSLAMIWGVVIGTYSSIFVAVPLLLYIGVRRGSSATGAGEPAEAPERTGA